MSSQRVSGNPKMSKPPDGQNFQTQEYALPHPRRPARSRSGRSPRPRGPSRAPPRPSICPGSAPCWAHSVPACCARKYMRTSSGGGRGGGRKRRISRARFPCQPSAERVQRLCISCVRTSASTSGGIDEWPRAHASIVLLGVWERTVHHGGNPRSTRGKRADTNIGLERTSPSVPTVLIWHVPRNSRDNPEYHQLAHRSALCISHDGRVMQMTPMPTRLRTPAPRALRTLTQQ